MNELQSIFAVVSLFIYTCIATCISFAFALLLCAVIERFVPQLLGQFPRYPVQDGK